MSADIQAAIAAVDRSARTLAAIALLPQRIGGRVQWTHNGVVWERIGENEWRNVLESEYDYTASSGHVASCGWVATDER